MKETPLGLNYIICLPLKIDFVCGVEDLFSNLGGNLCDPSNVIDASFDADYTRLKEKGRQFMVHYGNVSINYTASTDDVRHTVKSINDTSRSIVKKLKEKTTFIDDFVHYVGKFMLLIYFKVIYGNHQFNQPGGLQLTKYVLWLNFDCFWNLWLHDVRPSMSLNLSDFERQMMNINAAAFS